MMRPWLWPLYRELLKRSSRPILLGPWRGEVGFEVLYWIPWLRRQLAGIDQSRLVAVTRGGAGVWYDSFCGRTVDLFSLTNERAFRLANLEAHQRTGELKQRCWSRWDWDIAHQLRTRVGLNGHWVHPAWMFAALSPWWEGRAGLQLLHDACAYERLSTPRLLPVTESTRVYTGGVLESVVARLPSHFVAVRFYRRWTFSAGDFAQQVVAQIASKIPVVLLNSGLHLDEHVDLIRPDGARMTSIAEYCTPTNNLAVQTAVLSRASGFVGTYGGTAQLALRLGVPSVSFFDRWGGTAVQHAHLSEALALQHGLTFQVLSIQSAGLVDVALPPAQVLKRSSGASPYGGTP